MMVCNLALCGAFGNSSDCNGSPAIGHMPESTPFSARTAGQLRQIAQRHREAAKQRTEAQAAVSRRLAERYEALAALKDGARIYHAATVDFPAAPGEPPPCREKTAPT